MFLSSSSSRSPPSPSQVHLRSLAAACARGARAAQWTWSRSACTHRGAPHQQFPRVRRGRDATEATLAAARGKLGTVGEVATKRQEVPRNDGFISRHVLSPAAPPAPQQHQHLPQVPGPGGGGLEVTGVQAVQSGGAEGSNGAQALLAYRQPPPSQHQQQQQLAVGNGRKRARDDDDGAGQRRSQVPNGNMLWV